MEPTKPQVVTNPHDQFFRTSMKDNRVAHEFLKTHLPREICELINFNNLIMEHWNHGVCIKTYF